jgi:TonB family protein
MLRAPTPAIIRVQQLRQGDGGRSLARLYWSDNAPDAASSDARNHRNKEQAQTVRSKKFETPSKSPQLHLEKQERTIAANTSQNAINAGRNNHSGTAGSRYGSLAEGDLSGHDVRPALWTSGPNPALAASDFAQGLEGSVVVEITIDEQGNVVNTILLQSLSPAVDARVIEALQMAHFTPAKRDGVSIASKQDVYYHFPR